MYAVFKSGALVALTEDAQTAADEVASGCGDKLRKVATLEELAEILKVEQANACVGEDDHAGKQVVSAFNELRAEFERGAKRLFDQAKSCDRDDLKQQARDVLEKVKRNGMAALDELRRRIHEATADKPQKQEEESHPGIEPQAKA